MNSTQSVLLDLICRWYGVTSKDFKDNQGSGVITSYTVYNLLRIGTLLRCIQLTSRLS